jgi:hypothetical protein
VHYAGSHFLDYLSPQDRKRRSRRSGA